MPHFFFDLVEDGNLERDLEGLAVESAHSACLEASATLAELAEYDLRNGIRVNTSIEVRDNRGCLVFRATLTFESELY